MKDGELIAKVHNSVYQQCQKRIELIVKGLFLWYDMNNRKAPSVI